MEKTRKKLIKKRSATSAEKKRKESGIVYFNSGGVKQTTITESYYEPIPMSVLKAYLPEAMWQD